MRQGIAVLCVALLVNPAMLSAQDKTTDAEVLKGISQVENGDYDQAIFTLDTACRRLAADPERKGDLSQAYLYLGIAYFGKGHEAAAKAKFREAVLQFRGLSLSAEQYPPKIIDLFEAARAEVTTTGPAAPTEVAEPEASAEPAETKKGGSKMPLVLIGVGGAAVAGVALAAGGGGGSSSSAGTTSGPAPTTPPAPARVTRTFSGDLAEPEALCRTFELYVQASGTLEAEANWNRPEELLDLYLWMGEPWNSDSVAGNRISETSARLAADVDERTYLFDVCLGWSDCRQAWQDSGGTTEPCHTEFTLTVNHP
jgi:tetratricopeptide (TPR) repeat protein